MHVTDQWKTDMSTLEVLLPGKEWKLTNLPGKQGWKTSRPTTVWSIWHHVASTTALYHSIFEIIWHPQMSDPSGIIGHPQLCTAYTSSSSPYLTLLDIALKPAATQWRFRFRKASSHWTENDLQHISTQKTSVAKQVAYHASCTSQAEQRRTPPSWTSTYPSHLDQPLICQACCERSRNTWETNNNHML